MANAKRLPSGNYRVRVYSHTDSDGKTHYESFTASTKAEAEMQAAQFASSRDRMRTADLTVEEAVKQYINAHEAVLSPATIAGYLSDLKRMKPIYNLRIRKINSNDIQMFISEMTRDFSPKTIKNTYGLLHKSLVYFDPNAHFNIKLPKQYKKTKYAPSDDDVQRLFHSAPRKLQIAIALAAFHSFRRGEISALKFKDLDGNKLHVHADLVQDKDNNWIYKPYPKTDDSDRFATLPDYLVKFLGEGAPEDYIVGWMPGTISKRFYDLKHELGIDIRFHDLRHYYASVAAILQIPDIYTASFGGWKPEGTVMKSVYQNKIVSMEEAYAKQLNDHFEKLYDTKYDTAK
jgi:integrase